MIKPRKSLLALSLSLFSIIVINHSQAVADDFAPLAPTGAESYVRGHRLGTLNGRSTLTAEAKKKKKKKKKKNQVQPNANSIFVGRWQINFTKNIDSCENSSAPANFVARVGIDQKLVGTDLFDNSPLFEGSVKGDSIAFARQRTTNGCLQRQALGLSGVSNGRASGQLISTIDCETFSCRIDYTGSASKY